MKSGWNFNAKKRIGKEILKDRPCCQNCESDCRASKGKKNEFLVEFKNRPYALIDLMLFPLKKHCDLG